MAARSIAARKAAKAEREQKIAYNPLQATPPANEDQGISVTCVRARLQTLDALMARAKTDREWDNLSRAFDRLFRIWMVLTKTPGPGNRKPAPEPKRQAASMNFMPVPAVPNSPPGSEALPL